MSSLRIVVFPTAGVAHDAQEIALAHLERNAVEDLDGGVGVGEVHVVKLHSFDAALQDHGVFIVNDGRLQINGCEDAPGCCLTALQLVDENTEDEHGHGHAGADEQECHKLSSGDFTLACKVATCGDQEAERHPCHGVNHGDEAISVFAGPHGLVSIGARFSSDTVRFPSFGVVGLNDGNTGDEIFEHGVDIAGGFSLFAVLALPGLRTSTLRAR